MIKVKCRTAYKISAIPFDVATSLYEQLRTEIVWGEGVRSKYGFTRKAKLISDDDPHFEELLQYIHVCLKQLTTQSYIIDFFYLNYYEDGNMYSPNHSHKDSHQLIISLGEERILKINKTEYSMKNGDAVIFGSAIHGVPKSNTMHGRISIATFMRPV